jgi:hypothetical protein
MLRHVSAETRLRLTYVAMTSSAAIAAERPEAQRERVDRRLVVLRVGALSAGMPIRLPARWLARHRRARAKRVLFEHRSVLLLWRLTDVCAGQALLVGTVGFEPTTPRL